VNAGIALAHLQEELVVLEGDWEVNPLLVIAEILVRSVRDLVIEVSKELPFAHSAIFAVKNPRHRG
jgi:hypothetical protein